MTPRRNMYGSSSAEASANPSIVPSAPNTTKNTKISGWRQLKRSGHVYFAQRRFDEALRSYKAELQIGLDSLQPYEAELAYAYHDVALAFHALGRASEATQNYAKAEQAMSQARNHIELDELKPRHSATLRQIREHYLLLLQQTGQTAAAADLEKRIQGGRK